MCQVDKTHLLMAEVSFSSILSVFSLDVAVPQNLSWTSSSLFKWHSPLGKLTQSHGFHAFSMLVTPHGLDLCVEFQTCCSSFPFNTFTCISNRLLNLEPILSTSQSICLSSFLTQSLGVTLDTLPLSFHTAHPIHWNPPPSDTNSTHFLPPTQLSSPLNTINDQTGLQASTLLSSTTSKLFTE